MMERFGCVVALRSPAHITLIPPFWLDEKEEPRLKDAVAEFSQSCAGFEVSLRNFSAFKPRVIYVDLVPNQELRSLHTRLEEFLVGRNHFSINKEDRPLHPHVSIATRDLHKKAFREAWEIFKEKKYESSWIVLGISILKHDQKKWDVIFTSHFANDFAPS